MKRTAYRLDTYDPDNSTLNLVARCKKLAGVDE